MAHITLPDGRVVTEGVDDKATHPMGFNADFDPDWGDKSELWNTAWQAYKKTGYSLEGWEVFLTAIGRSKRP